MDALLKTAASSRGGFSRKLWLTVIAMFYGTGLRRGELIRLNIEDYNRDEGFLNVDNRKTGYPHKVPVPSVTAKFLEAWLIERHNKLEACGNLEEPGLFINPSGKRISGAGVSRGLQRLADKSGIGRITCYHFRHSCASDLLESGASLPEVQQVLGHQTICTTMRYTHITDPQRHEAADRHPINQILLNLSENDNAS
jgi:integrase/recombinase XerD